MNASRETPQRLVVMAVSRLRQVKCTVNRRVARPRDCIFCRGTRADLVSELRQSKKSLRICVQDVSGLFEKSERITRSILSEFSQSEMLKQCRS